MSRRFHLPRAEAVPDNQGRRHCAECGDFIDPIDWCPYCRAEQGPCRRPHRHLHKRADAAFCDDGCRTRRRAGAIEAHRSVHGPTSR